MTMKPETYLKYRDRAEAVYMPDLVELLKAAEDIKCILQDRLMDPAISDDDYLKISTFIEALNRA